MGLIFEWDKRKARSNQQKQDVAFEEASTIFGDALSLTIVDTVHSSMKEERFITIGTSVNNRMLVVVHVDQEDTRMISARKATKSEIKQYEDG